MSPEYNVYKVQYTLGLQDPAFSETRYHTVIFVETSADGGGFTHEVTGDIASAGGMVYGCKHGEAPTDSETFHARALVGRVHAKDYPDQVEAILRSLLPPPRQRWFNPSRLAWEQCKSDGTPYAPGEPRPPYSKCTEWTEQQAVPALLKSGLIR